MQGLAPTYTFHLCIERDDREIIDTTITAKEDPSEIAKAQKDLKRLLDAYSPTFKAPLAPAPAAKLPYYITPAPAKPPAGAKGLLRLHCPDCGNIFGTFLREYQTEIDCKCGHEIDLTAPLARYHFTCPYCKSEGYGRTNLEDPEIEVRCKCGENVSLHWNSDAKEYQN